MSRVRIARRLLSHNAADLRLLSYAARHLYAYGLLAADDTGFIAKTALADLDPNLSFRAATLLDECGLGRVSA